MFTNYNIFTEAKWISKWLMDNLRINAIVVPNGIDLDIFKVEHNLKNRNHRLRILIEGPFSSFLKVSKIVLRLLMI